MFKLLLLFALSLSFVPQSKGFALKEFVMDKIVKPVKNYFHPDPNATESKESGNLDFIGRDIIRETSKTIKTIGKEIKRTFSSVTSGLDCNKTLTEGRQVNEFKSRVQAIYPGTKWCGDGNISSSFDDLGKFSTTDKCCRAHDMCPDNIPAEGKKYGLDNTGLFTRSTCDCDWEFYQCLKKAHSLVADSIGYTYFTVLGPQCFRQDYPNVDCGKEEKGRCIKYVQDEGGEKRYQWFDNPTF